MLDSCQLGISVKPSEVSMGADVNMNSYEIRNQSDARLKDNISPSTLDALAIIRSIDIADYDWYNGKHVSAGMIAQQLEEVAPDLVHTDVDGVKSIRTLAIIPYLIKAIQQIAGKPVNCPLEYKDGYSPDEKAACREAGKGKK